MTFSQRSTPGARLPRTVDVWPRRLLLAIGTSVGLAASAIAQNDGREVTFISTEGSSVGTATLVGTPVGLLIELDLYDLPPETWHGFHIHETGECDAESGFETAGGHFAITDTNHGFYVDGGPHSGDMPNQFVSTEGTLKAQVLNSYAFLGGEQDNVTGRTLIIHSDSDDYESQPSGDAGDRIACAVIE